MGRIRIAAAIPVASVLVAAVIVVGVVAVPDTAGPASPGPASPGPASSGPAADASAALRAQTATGSGTEGAGGSAAGQGAVILAARQLIAAMGMRPEELVGSRTDRTGLPSTGSRPPHAGQPSPGFEPAHRTRSPGADGRSTGASAPDAGMPVEALDRQQLVTALRQLLTALDVRPEELQEAARPGAAPATAPGGSADRATITVAGFAFGAELTVRPGSSVRVVNMDSAAHNVTAVDGGFATETLPQGGSATFTAPAVPGRYAFRCTVHPEMTGTLVVAGAPPADRRAGSSSTPTTVPSGTRR